MSQVTIAAVIATMREHPHDAAVLDERPKCTKVLQDDQSELSRPLKNTVEMAVFLQHIINVALGTDEEIISLKYVRIFRSRAYHLSVADEPPVAEIVCHRPSINED